MPIGLLDRVTVTGADDSVDPHQLAGITEKYPFVEWGILLSEASQGRPRYPSRRWLERLSRVCSGHDLALSGHLCGRWVRDVCDGSWRFVKHVRQIWSALRRVQLNLRAISREIDEARFVAGFSGHEDKQYILQLDNMDNPLLDALMAEYVDVVPLFDLSGGAGILPKKWPEAKRHYCGYAGGLSPDNVQDQLEAMAQIAAPGPVWIDAETDLRSASGHLFDLRKVTQFLEVALPWVRK